MATYGIFLHKIPLGGGHIILVSNPSLHAARGDRVRFAANDPLWTIRFALGKSPLFSDGKYQDTIHAGTPMPLQVLPRVAPVTVEYSVIFWRDPQRTQVDVELDPQIIIDGTKLDDKILVGAAGMVMGAVGAFAAMKLFQKK